MTLEPCIYCRRMDVSRTKEHVLQHSLGASATLPIEVCEECNSAFSPIDKYFVEALPFYHTGGKKILRGLGLGRVTLPDGTSVNARYRPDGNGEFPPQLYQVSHSEWRFTGSREGEFHSMLLELSDPSALTVKSQVLPRDEGIPEMAIVRSSPNAYLVQGVDRQMVDRFCAVLMSDGFRPDWVGPQIERSSSDAPTISFNTSLAFDPYCRAMAKIALNYVCYRCGASTALHPEFDRLRAFARTGQGHPFEFVVPTVLNHGIEDSAAAFIGVDHHGLLLCTGGDKEDWKAAVFVVVEGKTVGRVDLGCREGVLPNSPWILLSRFDPAQRSVEDFTLPHDMPRAVVNPGAWGLQDAWPKEWL